MTKMSGSITRHSPFARSLLTLLITVWAWGGHLPTLAQNEEAQVVNVKLARELVALRDEVARLRSVTEQQQSQIDRLNERFSSNAAVSPRSDISIQEELQPDRDQADGKEEITVSNEGDTERPLSQEDTPDKISATADEPPGKEEITVSNEEDTERPLSQEDTPDKISATADEPPLQESPQSSQVDQSLSELLSIEAPAAQPHSSHTVPQDQSPHSGEVLSEAATEIEIYEQGFNFMLANQWMEARGIFERQILRFPQGKLADDAVYWIAETYRFGNNFEKAREYLHRMIEVFPDSPRHADAMLNLASIERQQGDMTQVRFWLQSVIEQYPNSSAARDANDRLKKLLLSGLK